MSLKLQKLKGDILMWVPLEDMSDQKLRFLEETILESLQEAYDLGRKTSYSSWGHPGMSDQELRGIQGIYG